MGVSLRRRHTRYALVITASNPKVFRISPACINWVVGLITGKRNGVSTIPFFVRNWPILPSRSLLRISKDNLQGQASIFELSACLFTHKFVVDFLDSFSGRSSSL